MNWLEMWTWNEIIPELHLIRYWSGSFAPGYRGFAQLRFCAWLLQRGNQGKGRKVYLMLLGSVIRERPPNNLSDVY